MNSIQAFPTEHIPNEDFVYRNIHIMKSKEWANHRRPNETDFALRIGEVGLSVNWDKYCTLIGVFVLLGLQKLKDGIRDRNPRDFKIMKFNVGDIRNIKLVNNELIDVIHKPELFNRAHAEICCEDHDEIRLKLCDIIEKSETPLLVPDFDEVNKEIEKIKEQQKVDGDKAGKS